MFYLEVSQLQGGVFPLPLSLTAELEQQPGYRRCFSEAGSAAAAFAGLQRCATISPGPTTKSDSRKEATV